MIKAYTMQDFHEDLLYDIFLHTLPSIFTLGSTPDSVFSTAPLNFSLVCCSWRNLVHSRPNLWSSITVEDEQNRGIENICQILKKWLSLSSPAPLKFSLQFRRAGVETLPIELMKLLSPEIHRWGDVDIFIHRMCGIIKPSPVTLPCNPPLASLKLEFWSDFSLFFYMDFTSCVTDDASHLRALSLHTYSQLKLPLPRKALRLPNLRELKYIVVMKRMLEDTLCILSASPNLVQLDLTISNIYLENWTYDQERIHLPHLTSFSLLSNSRIATFRFLALLTCPSLLSFCFKRRIENRRDFVEAQYILNFFQASRTNSCPALKTLELGGVQASGATSRTFDPDQLQTFEALFSFLEGLERLDLQGPFADSGLIGLLIIPALGPGIGGRSLTLPSLTETHFTWPYKSEILERVTEEFLMSRWKATVGTKLREVVLTFPESENLQRSKTVKACVEEGLKIRFPELQRERISYE
ncbi:hypothetical protein SCHPADRAFT_162526 [Schizopora paradoxa]|uniref:F-box domain-containing protein n=1 Tax=Schizopora paradoxa TaxID=27342 RepID=A0A0H2RZF1_9AGAM|nr:hypothetical protein SCHPADRAFT_162526 [Schizopora paradoxa]